MWLAGREEENNKYYVKFRKVFKELYKTIKEFISNNVAEPFYLKRTQRTLGLQKGTQVALKKHLSTPKALQGHRRTQSTRALQTFGQSDT